MADKEQRAWGEARHWSAERESGGHVWGCLQQITGCGFDFIKKGQNLSSILMPKLK